MPWETSSSTGLDWDWHSRWVRTDRPVMKFIKRFTAHTINMDKTVWSTLFCPPDLVAMAWALDSKLSTKNSVCHCYVDCGGNPLTRGQLIVDWRGLLKKKENITISLEWSTESFRKILEKLTAWRRMLWWWSQATFISYHTFIIGAFLNQWELSAMITVTLPYIDL